MKTHDGMTKITNSFQPVFTLTKDRFARIISSHVNLSAFDVNNICCVQLWVGSDIAF